MIMRSINVEIFNRNKFKFSFIFSPYFSLVRVQWNERETFVCSCWFLQRNLPRFTFSVMLHNELITSLLDLLTGRFLAVHNIAHLKREILMFCMPVLIVPCDGLSLLLHSWLVVMLYSPYSNRTSWVGEWWMNHSFTPGFQPFHCFQVWSRNDYVWAWVNSWSCVSPC